MGTSVMTMRFTWESKIEFLLAVIVRLLVCVGSNKLAQWEFK